MKKFLPSLFIFFFALSFQQATSQVLYTSTVGNGYNYNPGLGRLGTPNIIFDDANIPNALIPVTDSMVLLNVKVTIVRLKASPASVVKFYASPFDPASVGYDSFPAIPPVLLGSVNLPANPGELVTTTIDLGNPSNSLFTFKPNLNNIYPGFTTIFIGLSFSVPTVIGWELSDGPGYNNDFMWLYKADDATKPRYVSYFGTEPKATFNMEVYGREKTKILPIVLTDFEVQTVQNHNVLSWSTSQESNSDYYGIEHSTDGNNFAAIGQVASAGNTSSVSNYSFKDENALAGTNYYRLKMVDRDHSVKYSAIRSVRNAGNNISFSAYPNPALEMLYLNIPSDKSEKATISVTNVAGQVVLKDEIILTSGINKVPVKVSYLSTGTYSIKVQSGRQSFTRKFNKQ